MYKYIYNKSMVRPIVTYTLGTRPQRTKIKRMCEAVEIEVLRRIVDKTRRDQVWNQNFRQLCNTQSINELVTKRIGKWDTHKDRMEQCRRRISYILRHCCCVRSHVSNQENNIYFSNWITLVWIMTNGIER